VSWPPRARGHLQQVVVGSGSSIIQSFNDLLGNIAWTDADRVQRLITEEIPRKVSEDESYQNAGKNLGSAAPLRYSRQFWGLSWANVGWPGDMACH
jgi:type I restriction enzyme R subunit